MRSSSTGFAWILFGILLVLISFRDPWIPVIELPGDFWSLAGLLCGIVGLALVIRGNRDGER